ncbi:transposase [Cupriavidus pauculus]|uniref:transposase n=1 Tax=Cupriavidus pauculus TaxID=82633 RepID=UPI000A032461
MCKAGTDCHITHGAIGRPKVGDRAALNIFLFLRQTGIPWEGLPQELGFGSGTTCMRRLRDWQASACVAPASSLADSLARTSKTRQWPARPRSSRQA